MQLRHISPRWRKQLLAFNLKKRNIDCEKKLFRSNKAVQENTIQIEANTTTRQDEELGNGCHVFGDFKISGFSGSSTIKIPISTRDRDTCSVECQITVVSTDRGSTEMTTP